MDQNQSTSSRAGSRWLAFMGCALAVAGSISAALLIVAWQRAEATRSWIKVPCTILSSQVTPEQETANSPVKYRATVRYSYELNGTKHTGDHVRRVESAKSEREDAEAIREQFLRGQVTDCWVDPQNSGMAVLQHGSRAALYSIWFPLLFVVGGARMAWSALRREN